MALEHVQNGDSGFDARQKINDGITTAEEANSTASQALAVANNASSTANNAVKRSGDTMSGNLLISQPTGGIQLKASVLDQTDFTTARTDGTPSFTMRHIESGNVTQFIARDATGTALRDHIRMDANDANTGIYHPYALTSQAFDSNALTRVDYVKSLIPTRKKSEVHWTGLNITLAPDTPTNIVTLLNGHLAASGSFAPMFDNSVGKLTPFNDDRSVNFKLNLIGSFTGGSVNRALQLDFTGTIGNRLTISRETGIVPVPGSVQFTTFFSVNKNGNLATNGTEPILTGFGGDFIINEVLLIAEQETTEV